MTNQEAINLQEAIIAGLHETGKDFPYRDELIPLMKESCEMAIEALKKQIPKEPIRVDKNGKFDGNWVKICPTCKRALLERITTAEMSYPREYNISTRCWCGQAIAWIWGNTL